MTHQNKTFERINYTSVRLYEEEFEECTFKECDFTNSDLTGSDFINCRFENCNLTTVKVINTGFKEVIFRGCKLIGIEFGTCTNFLFSISCVTCNLNYSSFHKKRLKKMVFKDCLMKEVLFSGCDLSESVFQECNLENAAFEGNNLEYANFTAAFNYTIDPEINRMKKARFSTTGLAGLLRKYNLNIE